MRTGLSWREEIPPPDGRRDDSWIGVLLALVLLFASGAAMAEVRPFVRGSWQVLVAAHAGKPLVVHFWSLTCAPCIAEMPQWKALQKAHPEMSLVMVSTDPPDQAKRQEALLARNGLAGVQQWTFADSFAERLRFEVDRRWRGELPMTRLVGTDGKVEAITGTVTPAALDGWLARQGGGHVQR
jgi:thiol-disulfide isomerase/thioredoxin